MGKYGKVILLGIISIVAGIFAGPIFLAFGIITTIIALVVVAVGSRKKQAKIEPVAVVENKAKGFSRKTKVTLGTVLTIAIFGFIGMFTGVIEIGLVVGLPFMIAFIVHYRQEKRKLRVVTSSSIKTPILNRGAV
jgi:TRAP-type C4-dicarboxylate transport system permease large subunit